MTAKKTEFLLFAGEPVSQDLIDALNLNGTIELVRMVRKPNPAGAGWHNHGAMLRVDRCSPRALEAYAGRQAISALRQLFCLGLGESAGDGHISADAANPQAQEQLAASLEKLQLVVQTLGEVVSQQGAVLQKMQCAHGASVGETAIVAQQGGAV